MTIDERLAWVGAAVRRTGLDFLVLGGHAVRHYGVDRNTTDFDLYTSASTDEVRRRLAASPDLAHGREGPSWRPGDFVRFEIGRLPSGGPEWLEFWVRNHLLRPYDQVYSAREMSTDSGVPFVGLDDLIASKQTERPSDWQDIEMLEAIADERGWPPRRPGRVRSLRWRVSAAAAASPGRRRPDCSMTPRQRRRRPGSAAIRCRSPFFSRPPSRRELRPQRRR